MKKYFAAVGIFKLKTQENDKIFPSVILSGSECKLDILEMMMWTSLNWRILTLDQLHAYYDEQEKNLISLCSRSFEDTLQRLIVRGLVAEGIGQTDEEALYNLISKLYIIPLYQSIPIRVISFLKLTLLHKISFEKAKVIFSWDKKTKFENRIMKLAFSAQMSTAEIIKCIDKKINFDLNEEEIMEFLYDDSHITNDNIADFSRDLPASRSVISAISNLYLRKQILFERM